MNLFGDDAPTVRAEVIIELDGLCTRGAWTVRDGERILGRIDDHHPVESVLEGGKAIAGLSNGYWQHIVWDGRHQKYKWVQL